MTKDPKITLDTVRSAMTLVGATAPAVDLLQAIPAVASVEALAASINRLNEKRCNGILRWDAKSGHLVRSWTEEDEAANDRRADRALAQANALLEPYGATMKRFGRGGGLWPHVVLADGSEVTL